MTDFARKIMRYMQQYGMIPENGTILAGVSGGADSVCLLLVLQEIRQEIPFLLRVIHVEHGIRGEDSLADAAFVRNLCARLHVACQVVSVDVPHEAAKRHMGTEEMARHLRYEAFYREASEKSDRIAVAHHAEDHAETVIFHMCRGTGLQGLGGIAPVRGQIIRPLLLAERSEIEAYLRQRGQSYRTDATNADLHYARNRIRSRVLPELRAVNEHAVEHILQMSGHLACIEEYMESEADRVSGRLLEKEENAVLIRADGWENLHPALQQMLIGRVIRDLTQDGRNFSQVHMEQIRNLFSAQTGRSLDLPCGLQASREYEGVRIGRRMKSTENQTGDLLLCIPGETTPIDGVRLSCRVFSYDGDEKKIPVKTYTKWFDYDKIKFGLHVRNRKSGDFFWIDASGKRKKLKEYLINEKVPRDRRDAIWLIADGSHIVWIIGYRISEAYKVTVNTRRILEITYDGGYL